MTEIACPLCRAASLSRGEGKLDQSGDSYLRTVVWTCACCGYARYEPALRERWRPWVEEEPSVVVSCQSTAGSCRLTPDSRRAEGSGGRDLPAEVAGSRRAA